LHYKLGNYKKGQARCLSHLFEAVISV